MTILSPGGTAWRRICTSLARQRWKRLFGRRQSDSLHGKCGVRCAFDPACRPDRLGTEPFEFYGQSSKFVAQTSSTGLRPRPGDGQSPPCSVDPWTRFDVTDCSVDAPSIAEARAAQHEIGRASCRERV